MEYSKLWQYENVVKQSALSYSGNLAVKLNDGTQYDVSSPINTTNNAEINTDESIIANTLDSQYGDNMKFRITFKLHSDAISLGTKNILTMPGLASFITERNTIAIKLLWTNGGYQYVPSTSIINGWNEISLYGDNVYIKLIVNNHVFILLDSTKYIDVFDYYVNGSVSIPEPYIITGFSLYNYIYAKEWPNIHNANNWRIGIRTDFGDPPEEGYYDPLCGGSGPYDQRFIYPYIGVQGTGYEVYCQISYTGDAWGVPGGYYPGITFTKGTWTDIVFEYDNGYYKVGKKSPQDTEYTYGSNIVQGSPAYQATTGNFQIGSAWGDRTSGNTKYDMRGCFIEADGVRYSNKRVYDTPYPELKLGHLTLYSNSWLVLKDVEALKLED